MPVDFYPESKPYNKGYLQVSPLHQMYYEEFGNPQGIPVVYMHGGPGAGSGPHFHRMFDPKAFRIVVYDQRGAGQSLPPGETRENTPDHLVQDADALRRHLGIDKWHVYGGSWGSTLGLLYAEEYPENTLSLTLRGIWLMRDKDIPALYEHGHEYFPEAFDRHVSFIPEAERHNMMAAYFKRINSPDQLLALNAAKEMLRYHMSRMKVVPEPVPETTLEEDIKNLQAARIEAHITGNHTVGNRILDNIGKIQHIPTAIVQGRWDTICPPNQAWDLKKAMPSAYLQFVIAAHSSTEPEIKKALLECTDRIRDTGSPVPKAVAPKP